MTHRDVLGCQMGMHPFELGMHIGQVGDDPFVMDLDQ